MNNVRLAHLEISPIGLGAWAIGGRWQYGWGEQDEEQSISTLRRAAEQGVNWIDTAPVYGLGRSERIVGRFLRESGYRPLIFSKGGLPWDEHGEPGHVLDRDSLLRECDASCERLGVDFIDVYQIHWPIPDEKVEEAVAALHELREQGRIGLVGASNFSVDQLKRAAALGRIDVLQSPYSLIDRGVEQEVLGYCLDTGLGVINYSPMGSGVLTGKVTRAWLDALPEDDWRRKHSEQFREPKLTANLRVADRVVTLAKQRGVFPGAVAVAWTLANPTITASIVGARSPQQVDDLLTAVELELDQDEIAYLANGDEG